MTPKLDPVAAIVEICDEEIWRNRDTDANYATVLLACQMHQRLVDALRFVLPELAPGSAARVSALLKEAEGANT